MSKSPKFITESYPKSLFKYELGDSHQFRQKLGVLLGQHEEIAQKSGDEVDDIIPTLLTALGEDLFRKSRTDQTQDLPQQMRASERVHGVQKIDLHDIRVPTEGTYVTEKSSVSDFSTSDKRNTFLAPTFEKLNRLSQIPPSNAKTLKKQGGKPVKIIHLPKASRSLPPLSVASHTIDTSPVSKELFEEKKAIRFQQVRSRKNEIIQDQHIRAQDLRRRHMANDLEMYTKRFDDATNLSSRPLKELQAMQTRLKAMDKWESSEKAALRAKVKIAVVGAGMAGLNATKELMALGFSDVIILEASDRIGGRVRSERIGQSPEETVELGAPDRVIKDPDSLVYKLAMQNNLISEEFATQNQSKCCMLRTNGEIINPSITAQALQHCATIASDAKIIYQQVLGQSALKETSLAFSDYIRERKRRLINQLATSRDIIPSLSQAIKGALAMMNDEEEFLGYGDLATSLVGFNKDQKQFSPAFLIGNASDLCKALTLNFKPHQIKFNTRVKKIDFFKIFKHREGKQSQHCRLNLATEKPLAKPQVEIMSENGKVYKVDHVIVTVPVGHMKKYGSKLFYPTLSSKKLEAIASLGSGTMVKVFLIYDKPFWTKPVSFIWIGSNILEPDTLLPNTMKISSCPKERHILQVATVDASIEELPDQVLAQKLANVLEIYFKKRIPPPNKVIKSEWGTNSLFCGSHPYLSTKSKLEDFHILERPVMANGKPVVQFAGDYTSSISGSLLRAAMESGLREARRLANFYDDFYGYENCNSNN